MAYFPRLNWSVCKIVITYILISFTWILASDEFVRMISSDQAVFRNLSVAKGWFFVIVTAALLYIQITRYTLLIESKESMLRKRNDELTELSSKLSQQLEEIQLHEKYLAESEDRLRRAVVFAPFPLMIHAEDGEVLLISNTWTELTGYSHEDIPTIDDWIQRSNQQNRPAAKAKVEMLYSISSRFDEGEFEICTRSGQVRIWSFSSAPLGGLRDGRRAVISMAVDVTEQKCIENELKLRNQELDQFAYIVSHDLKAPLRAITNLSSWIEEDLKDTKSEEIRNNLALLRKRVYRMDNLIKGILEYSRVGRTSSPVEQCNIALLLADIIDDLNPPAGFRIETGAEMPTIVTDSLRLRQVLANLIDNAIKHHDKQSGIVRISMNEIGSLYEFSVEDDGPGIASAYHEKIFEMFQVLKPRDTTENTGVGLALVKKIVENQGGKIQVASLDGQGTSFRFTWPKQKEITSW
ncbi:sensor histidine kinase [Sporomusa sp.]|uniref:sensor histidine kinase n=1 Tax=Sporomusa sp. TaxID=2078658 RepID=UPI002BCB8CE5|nr:ATP-binding protein [Sporomusa sp.]HWR43059.1 ATP-binding protein [Sporomusa sp.]